MAWKRTIIYTDIRKSYRPISCISNLHAFRKFPHCLRTAKSRQLLNRKPL